MHEILKEIISFFIKRVNHIHLAHRFLYLTPTSWHSLQGLLSSGKLSCGGDSGSVETDFEALWPNVTSCFPLRDNESDGHVIQWLWDPRVILG